MNVLVTGANGFVGSHVAREFSRAGHAVTAYVRPSSDARFLDPRRVRIERGALEDAEELARRFSGFDAVVHVAALAADWGPDEPFFRANVLAAETVARAVPRGCHLVHVSTNAVLGEEDCARAKGDGEPLAPVLPYPFERLLPSAMNRYRATKAVGECVARAVCARRGIRLTVTRPVWVFGPREFHAGPFEYCRTLLSGVPAMPGTRANRFHVVYAPDLARAIRLLAESPPARERVVTVGRDEAPLMDDYFRLFAAALGVRPPRLLPERLLFPAALALEALFTLLSAAAPPLFTRARLRMFYASNVYDTSALRECLPGFRHAPLPRAVRATVRWWRMFGFLPRDAARSAPRRSPC